MKQLNFLVVGRNNEIIKILKRIILTNFYSTATITNNLGDFYEIILNREVDVVLLSSGLETEEESQIKEFIKTYNPTIKIIEHYGGGSGLLKSEVLMEFPNL